MKIFKNKNSIFTIRPYKYYGQWVFDDPSTGLDKEAFVSGADTMLDILSKGNDYVTMIFSKVPFPEHDIKIDYVGKESGGSLYHN